MVSKNGHTVPVHLGRALAKNKRAVDVFKAMRPSCQQKYMDRINHVKEADRGLKTPKIISAIIEYGKRHPEKRAGLRK
jgi:uncharacterized protein YdeI (YjbR/CyaY-like superfamily)